MVPRRVRASHSVGNSEQEHRRNDSLSHRCQNTLPIIVHGTHRNLWQKCDRIRCSSFLPRSKCYSRDEEHRVQGAALDDDFDGTSITPCKSLAHTIILELKLNDEDPRRDSQSHVECGGKCERVVHSRLVSQLGEPIWPYLLLDLTNGCQDSNNC